MTDIDTSKEGVRVLVNEARAVYAGTKRDGSVLDLIKRLAATLDALAKERDSMFASNRLIREQQKEDYQRAEKAERERDEARRMLAQSDAAHAWYAYDEGCADDEWELWADEACERHRAREAGLAFGMGAGGGK